jgi:hypothetical protein
MGAMVWLLDNQAGRGAKLESSLLSSSIAAKIID